MCDGAKKLKNFNILLIKQVSKRIPIEKICLERRQRKLKIFVNQKNRKRNEFVVKKKNWNLVAK